MRNRNAITKVVIHPLNFPEWEHGLLLVRRYAIEGKIQEPWISRVLKNLTNYFRGNDGLPRHARNAAVVSPCTTLQRTRSIKNRASQAGSLTWCEVTARKWQFRKRQKCLPHYTLALLAPCSTRARIRGLTRKQTTCPITREAHDRCT